MHRTTLENVGTHHPQEPPARQLEPKGELLELAPVEHREATECDVHDGSRRLRVEPGHGLLILWLSEVAYGLAFALAGEERANGEDVGEK
jgi:RNA 3'-terminal phosphate cyclase